MLSDSSLSAQDFRLMSQDQLNFALERAESRLRTGRKLTIFGAVIGIAGFTTFVFDKGTGESVDSMVTTAIAEVFITGIGLGMMGAGIPNWISGKNKKSKIEIELVKFKSPGMASINGFGIKIKF